RSLPEAGRRMAHRQPGDNHRVHLQSRRLHSAQDAITLCARHASGVARRPQGRELSPAAGAAEVAAEVVKSNPSPLRGGTRCEAPQGGGFSGFCFFAAAKKQKRNPPPTPAPPLKGEGFLHPI